jgi:hypothetical protein
MKHSTVGLACLLGILSCPALAQSDQTLEDAYSALKAKDYQQARSFARAYLLEHPRRYAADFIIAVSDCNLWPGEAAGREGLSEIRQDYDLTPDAKAEIDHWSSTCASTGEEGDEPPVREGEDNENTNTLSFLEEGDRSTTTPLLTPVEPARRSRMNAISSVAAPHMSELQMNMAYAYDDYAERQNVASAAGCSEICRTEATCRSMTYAKSSQKCWLKRSVPSASSGPGAEDFVSSYKIGR